MSDHLPLPDDPAMAAPALPDPARMLFPSGVPHSDALGIEFLGWGEGALPTARYRLPWRADLVGHLETGALFGGAVYTLIDYALGTACAKPVAPKRTIATIDLRVDYTRPSLRGRAVIVEAECYRATRHVAFARAVAFHDDAAEPLALGQGTFMLYDTPAEWHAGRGATP